MSNLLNEAIVDAKALRDAALKNAETIVIEKYSSEVRDTLDKLLEQDEPLSPDADLGADLGAGMEAGLGDEADASAPAEEITEEDIPLAATNDFAELEGKNLNSFPADGTEVEIDINLGALQESIDSLASALSEDDEEVDFSEDSISALVEEMIEEAKGEKGDADPLDGERAKFDKDHDGVPDGADKDKDDPDISEDMTVASATPSIGTADEADAEEKEFDASDDVGLAEDEDIDMDSLVDSIMEKLTVDMGADLAGWAGRSSDDMKHQIEKELAHRRSTDVEEELETLKKAHEELVFENNQLNEQNNKYKQATQELKENLQDVNLSNARLLYTNRVLRNTSLNERQKDKIVEAISGAGSVAEARTIYDTLQSTVEAAPKRSPQSLSEAIGRRSTVLRATRKEKPSSDPLQERMKRLAGIK
tara:strand:+ start:4447 stop:5709 length:1263 start_codon:yes stop_codon:yes gene_type:complete